MASPQGLQIGICREIMPYHDIERLHLVVYADIIGIERGATGARAGFSCITHTIACTYSAEDRTSVKILPPTVSFLFSFISLDVDKALSLARNIIHRHRISNMFRLHSPGSIDVSKHFR